MSSFIEFGNFRLAFPEEFATLESERKAELERWREVSSRFYFVRSVSILRLPKFSVEEA